jgi:hypothetical protein
MRIDSPDSIIVFGVSTWSHSALKYHAVIFQICYLSSLLLLFRLRISKSSFKFWRTVNCWIIVGIFIYPSWSKTASFIITFDDFWKLKIKIFEAMISNWPGIDLICGKPLIISIVKSFTYT